MRSLLLFFLLTNAGVYGLKCYSCTLTLNEGEDDSQEVCLVDPSSVVGKNIITCPSRMKFCTIIRNDYKTTGHVSSMERNCAESPIFMDEDIDSPDLLSHYRACQTDLCNGGNGVDHIYGDGEGGNNGAFVMPGSGASEVRTTGALIMTIVLHCILFAVIV